MVFDKILDFVQELIKDGSIGSDDVRLVAVASCEVLRRDDTHLVAPLRLNEQHLGMVVCEVCGVYDLMNERPDGCLSQPLRV